jgi:hypothetical protein
VDVSSKLVLPAPVALCLWIQGHVATIILGVHWFSVFCLHF